MRFRTSILRPFLCVNLFKFLRSKPANSPIDVQTLINFTINDLQLLLTFGTLKSDFMRISRVHH